MSQADELLESLTESGTMTYAVDSEYEPHIIIGADRTVTVPKMLQRLAVQYDHDVETVTFDCPRYWDGLDMSEMSVWINYKRADKEKGCYRANNVVPDESDESMMHFDWTVSRNVTEAKGPIVFLVCIRKTDEDDNEVNHWNSELCLDCYISEGLECSDQSVLIEYPDYLASLEREYRNSVASVLEELIAARDSGELKGDPFTYDMFTPEQLAALTGPKGDTGEAFTYEMFTEEQIKTLTGPKGDTGDAFTYDMFTEEQLKALIGPKGDTGDAFTYEMFTPEQIESLVGPKGETGDPFTYDMFTPEQLAALTGPKGDKGSSIQSIVRTSGTGAPGTTDTYTITMSDGVTTTFKVYNGSDGKGAGDMLRSVYDTENRNTDIFKYVDEKVGEGKTNVEPPNWNQSDPAAPDYIKNRPGGYIVGTERAMVVEYGVALDNKTMTFTDGLGGLWTIGDFSEYCFGEVGKTYIIVWDGVEYESECYLSDSNGYGYDELTIGGSDKGCPFLLCGYDAYAYDSDGNKETGETSHTITAYEIVEIIEPIDPKFLPTMRVTVIEEWDDDSGVYVWKMDKTHEEMCAAVAAGRGLDFIGPEGRIGFDLIYCEEYDSIKFSRVDNEYVEVFTIDYDNNVTSEYIELASLSQVQNIAANIRKEIPTKPADIGLGDSLLLKHENVYLPSSSSGWLPAAYGNGIFVTTVGSTIAYSTDGINWLKTTAKNQWRRSVNYCNDRFLMFNDSGEAAYSIDGITWTDITMPSLNSFVCDATYGNGKFVAITWNSNQVVCSADGINWTIDGRLPNAWYWESIAYGNGKFVAVGHEVSTAGSELDNTIAYSADGINWTEVPNTREWSSVIYADGKFVAVGYQPEVAYSTDGVNWIETSMPYSQDWKGVAYGNGKFVAVGCKSDDSTTAAYSTDGINWVETVMPIAEAWDSVAYGGGKFIAIADRSHQLVYSTDGITWRDKAPKIVTVDNANRNEDVLFAIGATNIGNTTPAPTIIIREW